MKKQNYRHSPTLTKRVALALTLMVIFFLGGIEGGCQNIGINTTGAVANLSAIKGSDFVYSGFFLGCFAGKQQIKQNRYSDYIYCNK